MRMLFGRVRAGIALLVTVALLAGNGAPVFAAPAPATQQSAVALAADMYSDEWFAVQLQSHYGLQLSTDELLRLLASSQGDLLRAYVTNAEFGKTAEAPTDVSLRALAQLANYIPNLFGASSGPEPEDILLKVAGWDVTVLERGGLDPGVANTLKGTIKAVTYAKDLAGQLEQVNALVKMGLEAYSDQKWRQVLHEYKERRNGGMTHEAAFQDLEEFLTTEYVNNVAEMRHPCTWLGMPVCTLEAREAHLTKARSEFQSDMLFNYNAIQLAFNTDTKAGVRTLVTKLSRLVTAYSSQTGDFGLLAVQGAANSITLINNGPVPVSAVKLLDSTGRELGSASGVGAYGKATVVDAESLSLFTAGAKFTFSTAGVEGISRPAGEVRRAVWLDPISTSAGPTPAERRLRVAAVTNLGRTPEVTWNLGDGGPAAAGQEIIHAFKCYGTYNIQATAEVASGSMARKTSVTVGAPWRMDWSTEDGEYAAATGVSVRLLADPSIPRDTGLQASWTFSDGSTAPGFDVDHTFPTKGTHSATLHVTDAASGCPAYTKTHTMQVARTDEWITLPFNIDSDLVLTSRVAGYIIPRRLWYGSPHGTTVAAGAKLTIPAGVRIKGSYDPDAWGRYHNPLVVHGELEVRGTSASPVEWTSWRNDELGGDANQDGDYTVPEAGDYLGIVAAAGSNVTMSNVSVTYSANFLDVQDGANVTVNNLTVRKSSGYVYGALNGSYATGVVSATGSGSLQMSGSDIENTAGGNGYAIAAYNAPNMRVSGSTFRGSGTGLAVTGEAGPSITNVTFAGFDEPIRTSAAASGLLLKGVTATGGLARITVQPGQLNPGTTNWSSSLPYVIGGDITVPAGSTLRMAAGTAVKGSSGFSWFGVIYNPIRVAGTLYVDGTPANPVQWTSLNDDSVRGPSVYAVAAAPAAGDWAGIAAQSGSAIHVTGLRAKFAAQIVGADPGAAVTVRDTTVEQSNADRMRYEAVFRAFDAARFELSGVSVDGAEGYQPLLLVTGSTGQPVVSNSTFANAYTALDLRDSVQASLSGTTFKNVRSPVVVQPGTSDVKMAGTRVEGGMGRIVVSGGQLPEGATDWNADLPYVLLDQITVPASSALNIGPGATIKSAVWHGSWSASYRPIQVFGSLRVNGTSARPVRWTSSRDADIGGPSEDTGTPAPTRYDWAGVNATFGSSVTLSHLQASYARTLLEAQHGSAVSVTATSVSNSDGQGYGLIRDHGATSAVIADSEFTDAGYGAALVTHGGQSSFENVTVRSAGHGIEIGGSAKPIIRKSKLLADGYQILNYTGTAVDAASNWWGKASGPSTGTAGLEPVFGKVNSEPWCLEESCQTLSTSVPALLTAPDASPQSVPVEGIFADVKLRAQGEDGGATAGAVLTVKVTGPATFANGAQEQELTTDENGNVLAPGPTAGTHVGAVTLTVTAKAAHGLAPLAVNLGEVRAGAAAAIDIVSGGGQTASPGADLGSLTGRVVDSHGNAVSGADVEFILDGPAVFGDVSKATGTSSTDGLVTSPAVTATDTAGEVTASVSLVGTTTVRTEFPRFIVAAAPAKEAVAEAVVFADNDGSAEDSYTVPAVDGVEYLVGERVVAAGTYPGTGTVTVTARAMTNYVFKAGAVTEWTFSFRMTPLEAVPAAVVFTDKDGTAEDTYTVPAGEGVEYLVGEKVLAAGTYPGSGSVTVTARAKTDHVLKAGAVTKWTATFKATPYEVVPAAVVFTDRDGTAQDTYTIPATTGVDYLVEGKTVAAGTYPGAGTVSVVARAQPDYVLKAGSISSWSATFKAVFRMTMIIAAGDLNSDGRSDVLARDSGGILWLYPGNGRGGWLPRVQLGGGWNAMNSLVAPGDLNGDRKSDLLARDTAGTLWLYPGNGRGGWLSRVRAGGGWNVMTAVVGPGDLTGDGKADVLARDSSGTLWTYPGNGRGGWMTRIRVGGGWNVMTAVVGPGDLNGDRKADVLARDSSGTLWLYPGSGRGGWLARKWAGGGWNSLSTITGRGDFNGDGRNDVLAVDAAGVLWLYKGNGAGGWLGRSSAGTGWN